MIAFVRNLFAFVSVFLLLGLLSISALTFIYRWKLRDLHFDRNIATIVCGDSHPMTALNDSILTNSINISSRLQHYIYTYNVLKTILPYNPQVKTILLGVSFHSFDEFDRIIFSDDIAVDQYRTYFPIFDYASASLVVKNNFSGFIRSIRGIIVSMIKTTINKDNTYTKYPFIGYYYHSEKTNLSDSALNEVIQRHYYHDDGNEQSFSFYQDIYLNKIVDLCQKKNIRLVLINTPVNDSYFKRIPAKFISNYYKQIGKFTHVEFWDFHSLHFEGISYGDGDHLNVHGAKLFSMKIDSLLHKR